MVFEARMMNSSFGKVMVGYFCGAECVVVFDGGGPCAFVQCR
jgi:hypothetical protein